MSAGVSEKEPDSPGEGARKPLALVAFGGNALLRSSDLGVMAEQQRRADAAAGWLVELVHRRYQVVVVHGNGPQVGQVLIQMEEAANKIPPGSLDVAVAQTEGSMGYLLEKALRNRLAADAAAPGGAEAVEVSTLLTMVVVDREDRAFAAPTKPIGPFFSRYRAQTLQRDHGWNMVEDAGRGWRKVVPSPRPVEVLGVPTLCTLLDRGDVVVAGGGGGIPVVRDPSGELVGVEAVIDKDRTAALLARHLKADLLINLTGIPEVRKNFGGLEEQALPRLTAAEALQLLREGEFPVGSMGPKIESALEFVESTGNEVLITDIETLPAAMAGKGGTRLVP
ncbi:MAG: carbamate kinase [Acidobacteriota bacterium]